MGQRCQDLSGHRHGISSNGGRDKSRSRLEGWEFTIIVKTTLHKKRLNHDGREFIWPFRPSLDEGEITPPIHHMRRLVSDVTRNCDVTHAMFLRRSGRQLSYEIKVLKNVIQNLIKQPLCRYASCILKLRLTWKRFFNVTCRESRLKRTKFYSKTNRENILIWKNIT